MMHPQAAPDSPLGFWPPRPTQAQQRQHDLRALSDAASIAMASDALAPLSFDQTCAAVLGHMRLRDDVDPAALTDLSNRLGRLAHEIERMRK